jgi:hypothetical protein
MEPNTLTVDLKKRLSVSSFLPSFITKYIFSSQIDLAMFGYNPTEVSTLSITNNCSLLLVSGHMLPVYDTSAGGQTLTPPTVPAILQPFTPCRH